MPPNTLLNFRSPVSNHDDLRLTTCAFCGSLQPCVEHELRMTLADDEQAIPLTPLEQSTHIDPIAEHIYEASKLKSEPIYARISPWHKDRFYRRDAIIAINRHNRDAVRAAEAAVFQELQRLFVAGRLGITGTQITAAVKLVAVYEETLATFVPGQ